MKTKLFALLIVVSALNVSAQIKTNTIPLIIAIDGDVPSIQISNGIFVLTDSTGRSADSVYFSYIPGRAILTADEYSKLYSVCQRCSVLIKFGYSRSYPHVDVEEEYYEYETLIPRKYLNDLYIILKVYNFNNPINKKYYPLKVGYGIEIDTPNGGMVLPFKKLEHYKPLKKRIIH